METTNGAKTATEVATHLAVHAIPMAVVAATCKTATLRHNVIQVPVAKSANQAEKINRFVIRVRMVVTYVNN